MLKQSSRIDKSTVIWIAAIAIIAATMNPALKAAGLLPADVFRSLGIMFPGLPQLVFGPIMAFLTVVLFIKTGLPQVFLGISTLRALALGFIFPANMAHLGAGLAGIPASIIALKIIKKEGKVKLSKILPMLSGLYAGFYASGNYLTTMLLGEAAEASIIGSSPIVALGIVAGAAALGILGGMAAYGLMRRLSTHSILGSVTQ